MKGRPAFTIFLGDLINTNTFLVGAVKVIGYGVTNLFCGV